MPRPRATAKNQVKRRRLGATAAIPIRGRPQLPLYADEDRHAVALLHMMLGTSIEGKLPSIRFAAWRAACSKEGKLLNERNVGGAPRRQLAATGRRNSPIPRALKTGYRELEFGHVKLRQGGTALENCALRLRRKHREWCRPGAKEKSWVHAMARAWAAAMYPHAVRRKLQDEPTTVCQEAARALGESSFCEAVLLPFLQAQEGSTENRHQCEWVGLRIF
jgi:hypothetical protein